MIAASFGMQAQDDFGNFVRSMTNVSINYSNPQVVSLYQQHYDIPQQNLNELYLSFNKSWGDVVLGIELSRFLNVPISTIHDSYQKNGGSKGWGVLAKKHGIKPGSAEFHRFKNIMKYENTYWNHAYKSYGVYKNPKVANKRGSVYPRELMGTFSSDKRDGRDNGNKSKGINKDQGREMRNDNGNSKEMNRKQGHDDARENGKSKGMDKGHKDDKSNNGKSNRR